MLRQWFRTIADRSLAMMSAFVLGGLPAMDTLHRGDHRKHDGGSTPVWTAARRRGLTRSSLSQGRTAIFPTVCAAGHPLQHLSAHRPGAGLLVQGGSIAA